jgi:hypothetical protein
MLLKDDRERDKLDAEVMLKSAEIEAKYGSQVNTANIQALMQRDREFLKQQGELERAVVQASQAAPAVPMQPEMVMPVELPPEGMM